MCGITGYFDKSGALAPIGATLLGMRGARGRRGPDWAGVGGWGEAVDGLVVRVALAEGPDVIARGRELVRRARRLARVGGVVARGPSLRFEIAKVDAEAVVAALETAPAVEVVSLGQRLEIVKNVGPPRNLDTVFAASTLAGTHGIGHTRLSTESRVDLSHSQ